METNFMDDAFDSFVRGKYAACRAILEKGPDEESWRKSATARWLVENNLVVCSCKEQLVTGDKVNLASMIDRLQKTSQMMQGLPPSRTCLPIEMTVSFNISALLLQEMSSREPVRAGSDQTCPGSTALDQMRDIFAASLKRALSVLGITTPRQADIETLLSTVATIAYFVPAGVVSLVSLQCCLLGLGHMIAGQYQEASDILRVVLGSLSSKQTLEGKRCMSSLALTMTLRAGSFAVDMNSPKDERRDADSLARFLLAVCLFQMGQWEACLDGIGTSHQLGLPAPLNETLTLIQGYCFYKTGSFHSALEQSTSLSANTGCDVPTKLKALNLIGCCLATLNKPHTAIQKFQEALRMDFDYLCPLYNISLVYRHLGLVEAETDALDLLIQALREREGCVDHVPSGSDDAILHPSPTPSPGEHYGRYDIDECSRSVAFVTHTLALRLRELGRHHDAAARYMDLLRTVDEDMTLPQSPTSRCRASRCLPTIQEMYHESALAMYDAKDYEHSLYLADKIITKMAPGMGKKTKQFDSSPSGREDDGRFSSLNGHSGDDALPGCSYSGNRLGGREPEVLQASPSRSGVHLSRSSANAQTTSRPKTVPGIINLPSSSRSESASSTRCEGESDGRGGSDPRLVIANSLLLKSSCLMQKKNQSSAMDTTNELLAYLDGVTRMQVDSDDEAGVPQREAGHEMEEGEEEPSRRKRRKVDPTLDSERAVPSPSTDAQEQKIPPPIGNSLLEVKAKAYSNKATLLIGQERCPEALHMLILGMQCMTDIQDLQSNHALLLTKMGRKEET